MILTEDGDDDGKDGGCGTHGGRQVTGSTFPVGREAQVRRCGENRGRKAADCDVS